MFVSHTVCLLTTSLTPYCFCWSVCVHAVFGAVGQPVGRVRLHAHRHVQGASCPQVVFCECPGLAVLCPPHPPSSPYPSHSPPLVVLRTPARPAPATTPSRRSARSASSTASPPSKAARHVRRRRRCCSSRSLASCVGGWRRRQRRAARGGVSLPNWSPAPLGAKWSCAVRHDRHVGLTTW
jgi:hypothetical protein